MTKQRRSFSAEFKRETAGLVLDQGYSHIEASRSLKVVESALRRQRWAGSSSDREKT
ncbi:transposase [Pseudomonas asplenii]|uniref:Transposase n=1 Tax=Pseudomonas asplenii TaxID=53407 RepID=A0A1H6NF94_9PSED|nr:transposase [Pseudomonas fuscovaginae]